MWELKLIALYFFVCERYEGALKYECQRFSNNSQPAFSDQEALTVYLYAVSEENCRLTKDIHGFARRHLRSWFPRLPSYQAFNTRMNRLCMVLQRLSAELIEEHRPAEASSSEEVVDSLPIMTCSGKRHAKVAQEVTSKGYCSTKGVYYYGLKLHALNLRRPGRMPWPDSLVFTTAAENDLTAFKEHWRWLSGCTLYGDKSYHDRPWFQWWWQHRRSEMLTPVKAVKGKPLVLQQFDKAADDLFSKAVSRLRQPLEAFFNWLIERTDIQRASKVRSTKGLLTHVFGKLAAAFLYCLFNP